MKGKLIRGILSPDVTEPHRFDRRLRRVGGRVVRMRHPAGQRYNEAASSCQKGPAPPKERLMKHSVADRMNHHLMFR
jgi:hypothetical protein